MKRLTITAAMVAMATTASAGDYPFEVRPFLCDEDVLTIIQAEDGGLSMVGASANLKVLKSTKGYIFQREGEYAGLPAIEKTFLEPINGGPSWAIYLCFFDRA